MRLQLVWTLPEHLLDRLELGAVRGKPQRKDAIGADESVRLRPVDGRIVVK